MKKIFAASIIILCLFMLFPPGLRAENKWTALVEESGRVLTEIQKMPDHSVPRGLLEKCSGIAVFPSTVAAGLGIGGKYGQGIIMVRDEASGRWSAPAVFTLVGGSIGWQIGGQATDFVLLVTNRRSVEALLKGKFKLGADASVSAGPVGRNAEASTDAHLKGGILSYSRSKGLFIGVKLEGAVLSQHWDANESLYGAKLSAKEVLFEHKARVPRSAARLLNVLGRYPYRR